MICVVGEALVDVVEHVAHDGATSRVEHAGGSPFNVAIGLARLGRPTHLAARFSRDDYGTFLRAHAEQNGVGLDLSVQAAEETTLAIARLDEDNNATYEFHAEGTADWQWSVAELERLPGNGNSWLHTGSLACALEPGATRLLDRLRTLHAAGGTTVSFDPNLRPSIVGDRSRAVEMTEAFVGVSDVVKASSEDVAWLYPEADVRTVLERWRQLGARVVAVTHGGEAVHLLATDGIERHATPDVDVVDTIGAGDSFMAAWIDALSRGEAPAAATEWAIAASAITCQRAGANPPTAGEVRTFLGLSPK